MNGAPTDPGLREQTLDNRRALVTGGTRGMGAAVATLLEARGARVVVTARNPVSDLSAALIQADLATVEGAARVAEAVEQLLGGLDIVVHCVGASFAKPGGALALTDDDWMHALNTNGSSPLLVRAKPHFSKHRLSKTWSAFREASVRSSSSTPKISSFRRLHS